MKSLEKTIAAAFIFALGCSTTYATDLNILWYTGGLGASYEGGINSLASLEADPTFNKTGAINHWNITYWTGSTMPVGTFNVLMVASGAVGANYSSLTSAITLSNLGDRIMVTGQDADWHLENSPGAGSFNGPAGFLIDAINWAGSGTGMGAVFLQTGSILNTILSGFTTNSVGNDTVNIPAAYADFSINTDLTSGGLSNWWTSAHYDYTDVDSALWTAINVNGSNVPITLVSEETASGGITGSPVVYWSGTSGNAWSAMNWNADAAGTPTTTTPASGIDVVFPATSGTNLDTVVDADTSIHSLTISSTNAVSISGSHTLTVSGSTGNMGITVGNGAGPVLMASNLVLAGASQTITVNNQQGMLISGTVGGTIGLDKEGSGILYLGNANTYSGGTIIGSGVLSIVGDAALGQVPATAGSNVFFSGTSGVLQLASSAGMVTLDNNRGIAVASGAVAIFDTNGWTNGFGIGGVISGNGGVTVTGGGVVALVGANTYTGTTTIQDGALVVNGSIKGDVTVTSDGMLGGSGWIGGSVINHGLVSPGNSPGVLTMAGDYTQPSDGALLIQIASPQSFDRVVVGGSATLQGQLAVVFVDGFTLKRHEEFSIVSTGSGVSGAFAGYSIPSTGTIVSLGLDYQPNQVLLEAIQGSFASVEGLTPNERAVARGLDKVVENSHVSKLVDTLDSLPIGAIPNALERIVPTDLLTMFDASLASSEVQANNLERRMEELRNGATGFSASGLNVSDPHGTRSFNGNTDGKQAIDKDGKTLEPAPVDNRWGFFINGSGEFVDTESTSIARGTDFTTEGITTGADYRLGDHAAVGVTAGYANTSNDGLGNGAVKIDSGKLGLYGTVFSDGFFLNSVLGGGLNSYDTRRDTLGGNARGDTDGTDYNALLGTGYTYRKGGLSVGPIASLRYSSVGIDSFTERGSLAPLKISEQSEDSLKSTAGMQASYAFLLGKTTVTPQIRAQWKHEYLDTARGIAASFLPGGSFTVYGPETGRDSLLLDVGATVQLTQTVGVFLYYNGDIGGENYTSHAVNGGVQVSF